MKNEKIPFYLNIDPNSDHKSQLNFIYENVKKIGPDWQAEQIQIDMFIDSMKSLGKNPSLIELGTSGVDCSIYSILFEKFFNYDCKIINTEPRLYLLEKVKNDWAGIHLINAKLYHGYTGESVQLSVNSIDILEKNTCGEKLRISAMMVENGIEELDILHADIQEQEVNLLKELIQDKFLDKIKFLFISTHSLLLHEECENLIKQSKTHDFLFSDPTRGGQGDGLIVLKKI